MKNNKMKIFKVFIFILILLIMSIITIKVFPIFKNIATEEGRNEFKVNIENAGYQGVLMIFGLMFTQIFFPILPGEPVELLAGMCFGTWGGLLVLYAGVFVTTLVIYFLVRKFGRDFILAFISEEKIDKIEKSKTWNDKSKPRSSVSPRHYHRPTSALDHTPPSEPRKPYHISAVSPADYHRRISL